MLSDLFSFASGSAVVKKDFLLPADDYTVKFEWTTEQLTIVSESVKAHIDVDLSGKR